MIGIIVPPFLAPGLQRELFYGLFHATTYVFSGLGLYILLSAMVRQAPAGYLRGEQMSLHAYRASRYEPGLVAGRDLLLIDALSLASRS